MSAPRVLSILRPQIRLSRSPVFLPRAITYQSFSTSIRRTDKEGDGDRPQGAHPTKHESRPVSSGEPVAEYVKEDESKRAGLPEEPKKTPSPEAPPSKANPAPLASLPAQDLFSLKNRTVIITGGGRGLGMTIARACLDSGANVRCLDLLPEPSQPQWDEAQDLASSKGLEITYHILDVTDKQAVMTVFSDLFKMDKNVENPIRGLFVAAGIQIMMPALEYSSEKFRKLVDINLTGTFLCAQAFANEWLKVNPNIDGEAGKGGASIAMTGSMSGHVANLGLECVAYNASKAGVNQLAKNLAMEWSQKGIRVNTLSPGYIRTALTAAQLDEKPELLKIWLQGSLMGRLSTPDEFRGPALYLLSDASSFMTGADLLVDGGHTAT
ncbi:uncharacterized protein IL334_000345 [Kwoniella shivajii]|uniref:Ketoreductase domain-containing protein n=1 Tax=Kwoniella shivajii TaxID=564305 RepID=A0ABZ1CQF1_9TREE|nr:hypothetical protein IL334_000345 [Kwoniella shivajii]